MPQPRIKVSGNLRTLAGVQDFAAIRTYTATAIRHGHNAYAVLIAIAIVIAAMRGDPWTPVFA